MVNLDLEEAYRQHIREEEYKQHIRHVIAEAAREVDDPGATVHYCLHPYWIYLKEAHPELAEKLEACYTAWKEAERAGIQAVYGDGQRAR